MAARVLTTDTPDPFAGANDSTSSFIVSIHVTDRGAQATATRDSDFSSSSIAAAVSVTVGQAWVPCPFDSFVYCKSTFDVRVRPPFRRQLRVSVPAGGPEEIKPSAWIARGAILQQQEHSAAVQQFSSSAVQHFSSSAAVCQQHQHDKQQQLQLQ
jgi:hypothetical protein